MQGGSNQNIEHAFSRLDLAATVAIIAFLIAWTGYAHLGERGRINRCAGNLAALGKAMAGYSNDHGAALPAAGMDLKTIHSSWDVEIFSYLAPGLTKAGNEQLAETVPRFFACPSDQGAHRGTARSYAMGGNDMTPENWPPSRDSATGVGLCWDQRTVLSLLNEEALQTPDLLPKVKLSDIPAPADTVMLTELIAPGNQMGSPRLAAVYGVSEQRQVFKDGGASFHHGRLNYLMVDGHVELLSPLQTGAYGGTAGIWSLKKGN